MAFQSLLDGCGQFTPAHAVVLPVGLKRCPQCRQSFGDEALHVSLAAQNLLHTLPFRQHLFRMDGLLGKDGAVAFGFVPGTFPAYVHLLFYVVQGFDFLQPQAHLAHAAVKAAGEQNGLHDGLSHPVFVFGHGHADPQCFADGFGFADDHPQYRAIYRIVVAI